MVEHDDVRVAAAGPRFLAACAAGDLATAKTIKDAAIKDRDWSVTSHEDENGQTAVHLACANGHAELLEWLVEYGGGHALMKSPDKGGSPPAECAERSGHTALAQWLIEHIAVLDLSSACRFGDREKMASNFTVDRATRADRNGWQAVHFACDGTGKGGQLATVQWLHSRGVTDLMAETRVGWSPMIFACRHGVLELAKWLREQGVVVDDGPTYPKLNVHPLDRACGMGHVNVAAWLHDECGVPLDVMSIETGERPVHAACFGGHVLMVQWLHERGAHLHVRNKNGQTPLDKAKKFRREAVVRWMEANAPGSPWARMRRSRALLRWLLPKPGMKSERSPGMNDEALSDEQDGALLQKPSQV